MTRTRHTVSGVIDENTPDHILTHPVLGKYLVEVDENAKPLLAVMHRPTTADEVIARAEEKADEELAKTSIPTPKDGKK